MIFFHFHFHFFNFYFQFLFSIFRFFARKRDIIFFASIFRFAKHFKLFLLNFCSFQVTTENENGNVNGVVGVGNLRQLFNFDHNQLTSPTDASYIYTKNEAFDDLMEVLRNNGGLFCWIEKSVLKIGR